MTWKARQYRKWMAFCPWFCDHFSSFFSFLFLIFFSFWFFFFFFLDFPASTCCLNWRTLNQFDSLYWDRALEFQPYLRLSVQPTTILQKLGIGSWKNCHHAPYTQCVPCVNMNILHCWPWRSFVQRFRSLSPSWYTRHWWQKCRLFLWSWAVGLWCPALPSTAQLQDAFLIFHPLALDRIAGRQVVKRRLCLLPEVLSRRRVEASSFSIDLRQT